MISSASVGVPVSVAERGRPTSCVCPTSRPLNYQLKGLFVLVSAHDDIRDGCAEDHLLERRRTVVTSHLRSAVTVVFAPAVSRSTPKRLGAARLLCFNLTAANQRIGNRLMHAIRIDRAKRLGEEPDGGHNRFHPDIPPVLEVGEGEEVALETRDAL